LSGRYFKNNRLFATSTEKTVSKSTFSNCDAPGFLIVCGGLAAGHL
jgi:hypothetical protein